MIDLCYAFVDSHAPARQCHVKACRVCFVEVSRSFATVLNQRHNASMFGPLGDASIGEWDRHAGNRIIKAAIQKKHTISA